MHGRTGCPNSNTIKAGDDWLKADLPRIFNWATLHNGVIFVAWNEGSATSKLPFLAIGPDIKTGFTGTVSYDHGSIIKSVEEIFGLPLLATVSGKNSLANLSNAGFFLNWGSWGVSRFATLPAGTFNYNSEYEGVRVYGRSSCILRIYESRGLFCAPPRKILLEHLTKPLNEVPTD